MAIEKVIENRMGGFLFNINSIVLASYGRIFDFEAKVEKFNTRHVFLITDFKRFLSRKLFFGKERE